MTLDLTAVFNLTETGYRMKRQLSIARRNKMKLTCLGLGSWFPPPSSSFFVFRISLTSPPGKRQHIFNN